MVDLRVPRWAAEAIVSDDDARKLCACEEIKGTAKKALRLRPPKPEVFEFLRRLNNELADEACNFIHKVIKQGWEPE